jgi:hypothetical protein
MKNSPSKNLTGVGRVIPNAPRRLKDKPLGKLEALSLSDGPPYLIRLPLLLAALAFCVQARAQSTTGIYVNSSNNVGIGTTNPQVPLQIHVGTDQNIFFDSSLAESRISIVNDAFNANPNLRFQAAAYKFLGASGAGPYLTINSSGNVGIGTANPTRGILHVAGGRINLEGNSGDAAAVMTLGNATYPTAQIVTPYGGGTLSLEGSSGNGILIGASGNVGIGTTNPQNRLVVSNGPSTRSQLTISDTNTCSIMLTAGASQQSVLASDVGLSIRTGASWTNADAGGATVMTLLTNGNVGIGTTNPAAILHIHGNYNNDGSGGFMLDATDDGDPNKYSLRINPFVVGGAEVGYQFQTTSSSGGTNVPLTFDNAGNVGIGTTSPQYMLDVAGQVHAMSFVAFSGNNYADFVFKPGYKLEPLSDVEAAIKKDGHLPGIPSEAEANAHGIDLASMQVKLLQKIEELTLHQIEQQKLLENQTKRLDEQSQRIEQLEQENTELRAQH